jgi:hypothetical protein
MKSEAAHFIKYYREEELRNKEFLPRITLITRMKANKLPDLSLIRRIRAIRG